MAKAPQFQFKTEAVTVVTPLAETLFMCLAEPNEYTGTFGGKLIFTEDDLDTVVKYRVGKGKEERATFREVFDNVINSALEEYKATGKKAVRADKIKPNTDADGNDTGKYEVSVKNMEKPRIINKDRTVEKDFDKLLSNGSTLKAQLYLKPYVMQGKVGVTAYLNTVLLDNVIEYGGNSDMFDEDDFDTDAVPFEVDANNGDF